MKRVSQHISIPLVLVLLTGVAVAVAVVLPFASPNEAALSPQTDPTGESLDRWKQLGEEGVDTAAGVGAASSAEGTGILTEDVQSASSRRSWYGTTPRPPAPTANPPKAKPGDPPVDDPVNPPSEPPAPPVLPGTIVSAACVSGDMEDLITFAGPDSGGAVLSYTLSRAAAADGPFSVVATAGPEATSFAYAVTEPAVAYYRVTAANERGEGQSSEPLVNARVSIASEVTPHGATLRSSNGEVALKLPPGAFEATTTVGIEEVPGSPTGGIVSLAGIYEITPSGTLGAPARLSVAYSLAVTHHQVSDVLLRAAGLMTYDDSTSAWVAGASEVVAEGGYLSGTLSHFSYWTGATIQPHGTSGTAVNYCSGVCHDLTTYPGSSIRYSSRDPQICYNCHGNTGALLPPAGASGPNIQAEFYAVSGQTRPAGSSIHPVVAAGLYCTACHDPHASPSSSPGLLKAWNPATGTYVQGGGGAAPGTNFCWTCHGAVRNRRTEYVVPGYFARTGGDKKTRFSAGAHSAGTAATQRLDTEAELRRAARTRVQVNTDGTVTLPSAAIDLPKTAIPVASPPPSQSLPTTLGTRTMYDDDASDNSYWYASDCGASAGNGWIGTASVTIDLGALTRVSSFSYLANYSRADVVQVQTSTDGVAFTPLVSQGTLGVALPMITSLNATADCRYVRFVFTRNFSLDQTGAIYVSELTVRGQPLQGTFEMRVDIPRSATYAGGNVSWKATTPASTTLNVTARASVNNGSTWTGPQAVTNGGSLTQIANGASLQGAVLEITATMTSSVIGVTPSLDWLEVTTSRGAIAGAPPAWTGEPMPNECLRCHVEHGSPDESLVNADSTTQCTTCHTAAYGGTYFGLTDYNASAHQAVKCTGCHGSHGIASGPNGIYGFLLPDTRQQLCFSCHPSTKAAFDSYLGAATEFARHDVYASEQAKTGSRIRCGNCHSVHSSTGLVNPDSITTPYTATRPDPTSIPVTQVEIYASKDTVVSLLSPTLNYGAASTASLDLNTRLLYYFDLSSIPAGAVIQNATLVLWTNGSPTGGFSVYPVSRAWNEGTGNGVLNSAPVNGATWLEWQYHDNANTANVAAGDWAAAGGDRGALAVSNTNIGSNNAVNVTSLVNTLRAGTNHGIMVTGYDASTVFPTYMRETATVKYRPKIRIWYQTGPATRQVIDDLAFCLQCHDGTMPLGLTGQSMIQIAGAYSVRPHGNAVGLGPESRTTSSDGGGGGLKAPYSYGMAPLGCLTCHDPHGSRLPFHLREVLNGRSMVPPAITGWGYSSAMRSAMGMADIPSAGWFCGACHIYPSTHNRENQEGCMPCHGHSGSRGG